MNLFVTVGTQLPFDRLIRAVDDWCAGLDGADVQIFGQIGPMVSDTYRPRCFPWVEFLEPEAFSQRFDEATHIVAHAGMGTIISTLVAGKALTVMPRRAAFGEQRNDHQLATVRNFQNKQGIWIAEDEGALPAALDSMLESGPSASVQKARELADRSLTDAIRAEIMA